MKHSFRKYFSVVCERDFNKYLVCAYFKRCMYDQLVVVTNKFRYSVESNGKSNRFNSTVIHWRSY